MEGLNDGHDGGGFGGIAFVAADFQREPRTIDQQADHDLWINPSFLGDRNGSIESAIAPKGSRRLSNINSVVLSLYSRGMKTRDIEAHMEEVYGTSVSRELISNITEDALGVWIQDTEGAKFWQNRGGIDFDPSGPT